MNRRRAPLLPLLLLLLPAANRAGAGKTLGVDVSDAFVSVLKNTLDPALFETQPRA